MGGTEREYISRKWAEVLLIVEGQLWKDTGIMGRNKDGGILYKKVGSVKMEHDLH